MITACLLLVGAPHAHADSDVIRELNVTYDVQQEGSVIVTWEADWDFGETGRRGIITDFVTREPWEDDPEKDARYTLLDLDVTSPTGANDHFTTQTVRDGEFQLTSVRVGSEDVLLDESRHSYVITYEATGMLRTFDGEPELFWDINSENDTPIEKATITVKAPDGVTEARCLVGDDECESAVQNGVATYTATDVAGRILSVVAAMPPGSVANAEPDLVDAAPSPAGSIESLLSLIDGWVLGITAAIAGALRALLGWIRRPKPRNIRWTDVAPGEMDPGGNTTTEPFPGEIAVRFTPPEGTLVETGRAFHAGYRPSHMTATLVQMAIEGSLSVQSEPLTVVQGDYDKVRDAAQWELYQQARPAPDTSPIDDAQAIALTQAAHRADPKGDLAVTKATRTKSAGIGSFIGFFVVLGGLIYVGREITNGNMQLPNLDDAFSAIVLSLLLGLFLGWRVGAIPGNRFSRPGHVPESLTARGSALKAQAQGFRQYLATAEARQLNFEADQDIYRRFLPWAILFDLTDRWTKIGEELVEMGRIPANSLGFVHGTRDADDLNRTFRRMNEQSERGERRLREQRRQAQRRRSSSRRSYGSGSGGRSGRSSRSRGGGGGGGSRSSSW